MDKMFRKIFTASSVWSFQFRRDKSARECSMVSNEDSNQSRGTEQQGDEISHRLVYSGGEKKEET